MRRVHPSHHRAVIVALVVIVLTVAVAGPAAFGLRRVRRPYPARGTAPLMEQAIAATWPPELHVQALNVGWCESTGKQTARNGQYRGLFQMGRREWAKYGEGDVLDAFDNAAAAFRYFVDVGGSFRPWQCQP